MPPTQAQIDQLWSEMKLERMNVWCKSTEVLLENLRSTHAHGGVHLHRYRVRSNEHFKYYAGSNRLSEINFVKKVLRHQHLSDYRAALEVRGQPKISNVKYWTDMYAVPGRLARILGYGGAYFSTTPQEAWKIATDFVQGEFNNRFEEVQLFDFGILNAYWFHGIAWDHTMMLFDKRLHTITILDITDTD